MEVEKRTVRRRGGVYCGLGVEPPCCGVRSVGVLSGCGSCWWRGFVGEEDELLPPPLILAIMKRLSVVPFSGTWCAKVIALMRLKYRDLGTKGSG